MPSCVVQQPTTQRPWSQSRHTPCNTRVQPWLKQTIAGQTPMHCAKVVLRLQAAVSHNTSITWHLSASPGHSGTQVITSQVGNKSCDMTCSTPNVISHKKDISSGEDTLFCALCVASNPVIVCLESSCTRYLMSSQGEPGRAVLPWGRSHSSTPSAAGSPPVMGTQCCLHHSRPAKTWVMTVSKRTSL
jgi:hypothetical protein